MCCRMWCRWLRLRLPGSQSRVRPHPGRICRRRFVAPICHLRRCRRPHRRRCRDQLYQRSRRLRRRHTSCPRRRGLFWCSLLLRLFLARVCLPVCRRTSGCSRHRPVRHRFSRGFRPQSLHQPPPAALLLGPRGPIRISRTCRPRSRRASHAWPVLRVNRIEDGSGQQATRSRGIHPAANSLAGWI